VLRRFPPIDDDLSVAGLAYRALDVLKQVAQPQMADATNLVVIARGLGHAVQRAVANEAVLFSVPLLGLEHRISRFSGQWRVYHAHLIRNVFF
jgi:hypothetical protein